MPVTLAQATAESGDVVWVGSPSRLTTMVNAVVSHIPLVANRQGTSREHWRRPAAYVYARPFNLTPDDRALVLRMSAGLMRRRARLSCANGDWLRLNGEKIGSSWDSFRDQVRACPLAGSDDWTWWLDVARRATSEQRAAFKRTRASLKAAGVARGTLEYLVLLTQWQPAIGVALAWVRAGFDPGSDEWIVRMDKAMADGSESEVLGVDEDFARLTRRLRDAPQSPLAVALRDHVRVCS